MTIRPLIIALTLTAAAAFISASAKGDGMAMTLKSAAFENNAPIPRDYTCDGSDLSPELKWTNPPKGTKSFALITDDPDAPVGTFTHWVIYDIPANATMLKQGLSTAGSLDNGIKQGRNDFSRLGYGGPCPPRGHGKHRYFFRLMALNIETLGLAQGATKAEVEKAAKGHVLEEVSIMGLYER